MFNFRATSCTISASTAESNLSLSEPLHPCSDNDGKAVPKLKGYSYSVYMAHLSIHLLNLNFPCCRANGLSSSERVTVQHLSWSWLGFCYLELPLLSPTVISRVSGDRSELVSCISAVVNMPLGKDTVLNKGFDSDNSSLS